MPNGKNTGSDTGAEQHRDLKKVINEFKVLHLRHLPASVVHISDADGIRNFTRCEWGCLTKSSPLKRKGGLLENALSLRTSAHAGVAIPRIFKHLGRKTKLFPSNRGAATPVTSVTGSQRHTFLTAPVGLLAVTAPVVSTGRCCRRRSRRCCRRFPGRGLPPAGSGAGWRRRRRTAPHLPGPGR